VIRTRLGQEPPKCEGPSGGLFHAIVPTPTEKTKVERVAATAQGDFARGEKLLRMRGERGQEGIAARNSSGGLLRSY
jgi:hypothetical protein